ncbi:hypothetical protein RBG61_09400 [Paludicola sp. MB14-C6]|uniref:hypothetical protein n=1 Tax=Paludihabitans sp. MB14-C6 TaxID=3070656 RepID=UPI0027DAD9B2|nr:hypothetical protein [Paludicola sp. MB14-C6]WMJ22211.1 hypothetical protein RBG61_09400 [Paludicola sp. MB14-C6]
MKKVNKMISVLVSLMLVVTMLFGTSSVWAHEMCMNGSEPVVLKWINKNESGTFYYTKVNSDNLGSDSMYHDNYQAAVNMWTNSPTKALSQVTDFTISNVDLYTDSAYNWYTTERLSKDTLAYTILYDTNYNMIYKTNEQAINSTKEIIYAKIMFNPNHKNNSMYDGLDEALQTSAIAHEIGHVYTLGHSNTIYEVLPSSIPSIMKASVHEASTYIAQHDIDDMNIKY